MVCSGVEYEDKLLVKFVSSRFVCERVEKVWVGTVCGTVICACKKKRRERKKSQR